MWDWLGELLLALVSTVVVIGGAVATVFVAGKLAWRWTWKRRSLIGLLQDHFRPLSLSELVVTERRFPLQIRADLNRAIDEFLAPGKVGAFVGVNDSSPMGGVDLAALLNSSPLHMPGEGTSITAPQYEQIDIGEAEPLDTLRNGLWLHELDRAPVAILFAPISEYGGCGVIRQIRLQVAHTKGAGGVRAAQKFLASMESAVAAARCYRGKILSLESDDGYSGQSSGIRVHRLSTVAREQVVLPPATLELLDRNIVEFVRRRPELGRFRMATKKGLLFYGPPGTGKTHTIRYLAGALLGHTTLLVSAEQVGLLGEYMTLARLLQPSLVVIEDADLIARDRARSYNPHSEALLNKLLNEMDGLREDCHILFILTTNRPEDLEAALASRPGRIDQAIEFPLPDSVGREKLIRLYSQGLGVPDAVLGDLVARTERVSAAFLKELMRRSAQFHLERNGSGTLASEDARHALEEMLLRGGTLNLKLLGAEEHVAASAE